MNLKYLTFDTADPARIAGFWGAFLGGEVNHAEYSSSVWWDRGPRLLFLTVPEPKTAKNRCHPDFHTPHMEREVARAVSLGAVETGRHHEESRWVVLEDPDGNEFCIVEDDEPDPHG